METSVGKRIVELRKSLNINQFELGRQLGTSSMAISRWERDLGSPTGIHLIKLGNLAHESAGSCWDFWNLAGLTIADIVKVLPIAEERLRRTVPVLQMADERQGKSSSKVTEDGLVAIPFLNVVAVAGTGKVSSDSDLTKAKAEYIIAAPRLWCPNPRRTVCMRVKGSSMEPTLFDSYIIVVDQAQTDKRKLKSKMVVAHHEKFGLVVARYFHMGRTEALVSDNRRHDPVAWSPAWRIVGKVLWYIGEC